MLGAFNPLPPPNLPDTINLNIDPNNLASVDISSFITTPSSTGGGNKNDNNKLLPYKNVKITDLARNIGQIVKNNKWEVEDANDIVDKVVDNVYNYFEVQFETNEDEINEKPANIKNKFKRFKRFNYCMRGPDHFEMNDDGDRVDEDDQLVTPTDFKNGKLFEVKLKKKAKMILKE